MMKGLEGLVVFARFERTDVFNWTDPSTNQIKPIRSIKVLMPHGDGTVTRESLSLPPDVDFPTLKPQQVYGFPCTVGINKKRQEVTWTLRRDLAPFVPSQT